MSDRLWQWWRTTPARMTQKYELPCTTGFQTNACAMPALHGASSNAVHHCLGFCEQTENLRFSSDHRPATSPARTTSLARLRGPINSGYVRSLRRRTWNIQQRGTQRHNPSSCNAANWTVHQRTTLKKQLARADPQCNSRRTADVRLQ